LESDLRLSFRKLLSQNYQFRWFRESVNSFDFFFLTSRSYASLGTVHEADDTTIINAYIKQIQDDPANTVFYLECLQDIGSSLQSRKINHFADNQVSNGIFTRFALQRAYRTLEIDHPDGVGDDGIIAVFQSRCADAPDRERDFQAALTVIQHFRKGFINNNGRILTERRGIKLYGLTNKEMNASEAYKRLRITNVALPDDLVIANFVSCV
jgi:hypothetical protein